MADRFAHVFKLEIDELTTLARLDARREHHEWGRIGQTLMGAMHTRLESLDRRLTLPTAEFSVRPSPLTCCLSLSSKFARMAVPVQRYLLVVPDGLRSPGLCPVGLP